MGNKNDEFEKLSLHFANEIDIKGEHVPVANINLLKLMPSKFKKKKERRRID